MKNTSIVTQAKFINFSVSCIMCVEGITLLFLQNLPGTVLKIILSSFFIVIGAAKLFGYFCNDLYRLAFQFDFAIGAFFVLLGGLTYYPIVFENLPIVVCFFALISALLKIQTSFDAKKFGMKMWLGMLISAIFVAIASLGTAFMCANELIGWFACYIMIILIGALDAWFTMYTVRVRVKKKNKEEHFEALKK